MAMLFLARHGQTDWNRERRWQGHADPPLNATGRAESKALAGLLQGRGIGAVYSSDLLRSRETAEIVTASLRASAPGLHGASMLAVRLDPRLREVDVGEWSGLTMAEVETRYPEGYRRRREGATGWAEGERYEAMSARVVAAVKAIAAAHPDGRVLVVAHGGPLRAVWTAAGGGGGAWVNAGNCDFDEIEVVDGRIRWLDSSRGGLHQQIQG